MTDPICTNFATADCFAKKYGRCTILSDTNFKNRKDRRCSFYKSKHYKEIEDAKCKARVENLRGSNVNA